MGNWIVFLLESSVSIMFFYTLYQLFLRKETFFKVNRFYLQITLLISLTVPLFDLFISAGDAQIIPVFLLDTVVVSAQKIEVKTIETIHNFAWIPFLIIIGSFLFSGILVYGLLKTIFIIRQSVLKREPGVTYVINSDFKQPFSFLHYIFVSPEIVENQEYKHIIAHEKVHVKQKHTLDLLFSGIVSALQWFNPFAWFYRESFREIHEYLADEQVLQQGVDPTHYRQSVYHQATGQLPGSFSFFNVSFIKRRFKMMTRIKSPKSNMLKVLLMVPVAALLVLVFACTPDDDQQVEVKEISSKKATNDDGSLQKVGGEPVYMIVEEMPEYSGGQQALFDFIKSNVEYPVEAKKEGIYGKVFVRFMVDKEGKVSNVEVLRSVHPLLDEEARRVVASMPDWKPGKQDGKAVNVFYQVPINFQLK